MLVWHGIFSFNILTSKLAVVTWNFTTTSNLDFFFFWFESVYNDWHSNVLSNITDATFCHWSLNQNIIITCGNKSCWVWSDHMSTKTFCKFSENQGNMLRHPASWMKSQTGCLQQFVKLIMHIHIFIACYHPKVSSCGLSPFSALCLFSVGYKLMCSQ